LAEQSPSVSFVVGETYRRTSLHEIYGGQRQGGISTPQAFPIILLFTGDSGKQYGYQDGFRADGTFWYTGEGQRGDMQMVRGNRAIRYHEEEGRELHLFESVERGQVRYLGQGSYLDFRTETAPDLDGQPRNAIVFQLAIDAGPEGQPVVSEGSAFGREIRRLLRRPLEELRRLAYEAPAEPGTPAGQRIAKVYRRNAQVKAYVLRRANGICEGCDQPAPFKTEDGKPYLEPHHIRRLADEGPDHPMWVAALCPNCHRRVHHSVDGSAYNERVAKRVRLLEQTGTNAI
jgi:5-methylcytosine-specific restriction protein A